MTQELVDRITDGTGDKLAVESQFLGSPYTPSLALQRREGVVPLGFYRGGLAFVDLDKLVVQPLVQAETLYALDRIDDRDRVEVKIAAGAAIASKASAKLEVPAGEVWFLNRVVLTSPAESGVGVGDIVQVNFCISAWPLRQDEIPLVEGAGRKYWAVERGTAALDTYTVDLSAQGELGAELRLTGGDFITLYAELTGAPAGADLVASLTPYGRKGKLLVT